MKGSNDGRHIFTLDYETSAFLYGDKGPPSSATPPYDSFPHPHHSTTMKQEWRRYGAARRKELVAKDEKEGGTRFELHKKCRIDHYFSISDRVLRDFRTKCEDSCTGLEETYIMGHRLLAFVGQALPQHPDYDKASSAAFRAQAALDLEWIQDKMQDIALKIDEEQLNVYITMDFDPQPEDDSTISSAEADFSNFADFSNAEGWEDFTEWAFAPSAVETDASSSFNTSGGGTTSGEDSGDAAAEGVHAALSPRPTIVLDLADKALLDESLENADAPTMPQAIVQFNDLLEDDSDSESEDYRYDLNDARRASSFLKKIAKEDVSYESDSEAVDSWAQDGESGSRASSGTTLTYDPARIAFRELMNKVPRMSASPPPPPNSPSDVSSRKTREGNRLSDPWATFDFATVRQTSVI